MFSLRNKKNNFELSSILSLIWTMGVQIIFSKMRILEEGGFLLFHTLFPTNRAKPENLTKVYSTDETRSTFITRYSQTSMAQTPLGL